MIDCTDGWAPSSTRGGSDDGPECLKTGRKESGPCGPMNDIPAQFLR